MIKWDSKDIYNVYKKITFLTFYQRILKIYDFHKNIKQWQY